MDSNTLMVVLESGIYYIKNKANGKMYIGQSKDIKSRTNEHKRDLRSGRHVNWHLQKSFERYGERNFEFGILDYCNVDELDAKEVYYIEKYNSMNRHKGYNLKSGGDRITFSQETLDKMSETRKALCEDESYLIKMSWARSELTEQQVVKIKTMLFNDVGVEDISEKINVSYNQVRHIKDNNSFTHILSHYNHYIKNREDIYRSRTKKVVLRMYREGYSFKEMALLLGTNQVTPYRIAKEITSVHDERCRNNVILASYKKRESLVKTLNGMGYSAMKISRTLKTAKAIVYDLLHDRYDRIDYGGKLDVYRYKGEKVAK